MNDNTVPLVIDIDVIRNLRLRGKYEEAEALLRAFRADVKRSGRDAYNEELRKEYRIRELKGLCMQIGCKYKAKDGSRRCVRHSKRVRKKKQECERAST